MQCPDCHGKGEIIATHVKYADGRSGWGIPMTCLRCEGAKEVPDEMAD